MPRRHLPRCWHRARSTGWCTSDSSPEPASSISSSAPGPPSATIATSRSLPRRNQAARPTTHVRFSTGCAVACCRSRRPSSSTPPAISPASLAPSTFAETPMTRRLLSDTDGLIEAIALCLPRGLEHRELMAAHRGLLRQLPAEIAVTLATPPEHVSAVSSWLDRQHQGRHAVVAAGEELDEHAIWVQDPLLVTTDRGRRAYLRVASEYPYPVAHWLAAADGTGVDRTQLHLSGGNSLVGHNFRFAGADAVLHDAGRGMPAAIRRAVERHRSLDPRRLHIYGYGETPIAGMPWAQEPFHLDLALALTGCHTAREHPIVLLARPQPPSPALAATAKRLAGDGF